MWKVKSYSVSVVFNGVTFRRYPNAKQWAHRMYYIAHGGMVKKGIRYLHQEVWKQEHGAIPSGHEIHHKDDNPLNNTLENLECITVEEHIKHHKSKRAGKCTEENRAQLASVSHLAAEWHRSDTGRAWHREHIKKSWKNRQTTEVSCQVCGETYQTPFPTRSKYCSTKCRGRLYASESRQKTKATCKQCNVVFVTNKYRPAATCSRMCTYQAGSALLRINSSPA